jgi:two-component system, cell cycle response regulator DivK
MAGESILVIDDTPVNLKLTRILLVNEGYKVMTAGSAEEALALLRSFHPRLILCDIQLPGMDGLDLTRRLKQDSATRDIIVIALTAFAMKGDERKAEEAGCDGYITKPIDTRTLGTRLREHLDRTTAPAGTAPESSPAPAPAAPEALGTSETLALRRRFLSEGQERTRQWLLDLEGQFNANDAARLAHQWIGAGGLLGYSAISRLAREAEGLLLERPVDGDAVRESLTDLAMAFSSPREARDTPVPESLVKSLAGKRVAVVALPASEARRLCAALERCQAVPVFYDAFGKPVSGAGGECDLAVVYVGPGKLSSPWLDPEVNQAGVPMVLVGSRDRLLELERPVQALAGEFLMDSWQPEEALVRLSLALAKGAAEPRPEPVRTPRSGTAPARPRVLVADDDPTVIALVRIALQNFGMECHTAADGPEALEALRAVRPHAAVLDVNMPGMDGYQVLEAIRSEDLPVRVLLLTARQQEHDVIRGFALGADDYVVKPFSPMELVARLKRLLWR